METIVFIGCNKSGTSRDALAAAKGMGYMVILLTNRKEFIKQRDEFPEVHEMIYMENLLDKENVFNMLDRLNVQKKQVKAVMSFIDPFVSYAATISKERGLAPLTLSALAKMEDKTCIRDQLKHLSVSPLFFIVQLNKLNPKLVDDFEKYLPLIIKPPISNGSKDVILVQTKEELEDALLFFERKFPNGTVLLEEYLIGPQYLIEVIVHRGKTSIAAVIEQEILQSKRFIITGYKYPADLDYDVNDKLETAVKMILNKLDLKNGNCHLEMRLVKNEWKLIEINPRMSGGAMNRIIQEGTGINLAKEIIKLYLNEGPSLMKTKNMHVYTKFVTINSRGRLLKVTGKNRALAYEGVKDVYIKPRKGAILTQPYSLGNRYAYVLASAQTAETAKKIALEAANEIKFYLEPL